MANSFLKNFSYLIAGSVLGRALNMVTNIILARWLEPNGYGEYSLVLTYIALFSAISSLGMQFIINKYVARNQENSKVSFNMLFLEGNRMRYCSFIAFIL